MGESKWSFDFANLSGMDEAIFGIKGSSYFPVPDERVPLLSRWGDFWEPGRVLTTTCFSTLLLRITILTRGGGLAPLVLFEIFEFFTPLFGVFRESPFY